MMENDFLTTEQRYKRARKQAREIRSFYINLMCYCAVIPALIYINLRFSPQIYWFFFSMAGWGLGLFFHAMSAFGWSPFFGRGWEERKLKQFLEEEQNKHK